VSRDDYLDDLVAEANGSGHASDGVDLARALAALGELSAEQPPASVRRDLVRAIESRPRKSVEPMEPADLYVEAVSALSELLATLTDRDWHRVAAPYSWTVQGLVGHLAAIEEYTARQMGLTALPPCAADDVAMRNHLAIGADNIEEALAGPPESTAQWWLSSTDPIVNHARSADFEPTRPTPMHGWPFDCSTALVARAFEIWAHSEDICRATDRPVVDVDARVWRTMSQASVSSLPLLLAFDGGPALTPTRIVLTGRGGATFDIGDSVGLDDERTLLVADVGDYCRVVARRVDPDSLAGERTGDVALIDALLRAAQLIAV
jgi:uncharacterized protein (TIGR03083 family)